jgi:hypothetical protein
VSSTNSGGNPGLQRRADLLCKLAHAAFEVGWRSSAEADEQTVDANLQVTLELLGDTFG